MNARIEGLVGFASLQGKPMVGYRRFGVPTGGAFDQESYLLGMGLVGANDGLSIELSNAAIEIVFSAPTRIAITGAESIVSGFPNNSSFEVQTGHVLKVSAAKTGVRTYVSVKGGWLPEGIESPLARSGHILRVGDVLQCSETSQITGRIERLASQPLSLVAGPLRILPGLHSESSLIGRGLTVSNDSDRMGIRLNGLAAIESVEIASEPSCAGAIQRTPSGQCIAIGPDGPTIGGYPKVAFVCSADLDRLAHLRPGQEVTFAEIDQSTARVLAAERKLRLDRTIAQIRLRG